MSAASSKYNITRRRNRSKSLVRSRKRRHIESLSSEGGTWLRQPPPPSSSTFEAYVATANFLAQDEHGRFLNQLRHPLPISFRIRKRKTQEEFVQQIQERQCHATPIPGVPGAYQMSPDQIEHNHVLRRWLGQNTKDGNISRQEFVSMLPVLLLNLKPDHVVLDLCASPGSKTTQAVDALYMDIDEPAQGAKPPKGLCVANEIDPKRAYILAYRCRETLQERHKSLTVTCHNATKFPNVESSLVFAPGTALGSGAYDRIVCDVPCSGDGTLRKDIKVWKTWHPSYGIALHPLQVRIAKRGIALLKMGGIMTYSTCSFHPIENEAVVAALLATSCVEILPPTHLKVAGIRHRQGLEQWRVLDDELHEIDRKSRPDLPRTLWPPENDSPINKQLSNCVRMVPHDNNTGGFFIAVLKKVKELPPSARSSKKIIRTVTPRASHHHLYRQKGDQKHGRHHGCVAVKRSPTSQRRFFLSKSLFKHVNKRVGSKKLNVVSAGYVERASSHKGKSQYLLLYALNIS